MDSLLIPVLLGIVEGVTEFLPISSTGHLIITGHWIGFTGEKANIFEVVIQLGAILAVVSLYRQRFLGLLRHDPARPFSGLRGISLLFLTSVPASILGLLTHDLIKTYLFNTTSVAWALAVGAVAILLIERYKQQARYSGLDAITPALAVGIGLFQCLALWPGSSRSGATIMGGMVLGASRKTAAEYSFIAAVPIMFAATGFDLLQGWALFDGEDFLFLGIGFIVSYISAWFAVKSFILLLSRVTLRPFAVYRLLIAPLVLLFKI
ncbi:MAG: undecaprenyl-diphosphate phosphatase, partial [Desulfohalobiaceae bacterium]|nr:undecaprenyl-diphosphate phosphatase [Desulfohalobiaceae bacterium]